MRFLDISVKKHLMDEKTQKTYRIFLSAAEASGDRLCAKLINALKKTDYDIEFVGLGGEKMAEAGCEIIKNTTKKAAMLYQALTEVAFFIVVIRKVKFRRGRIIGRQHGDVIIVADEMLVLPVRNKKGGKS